MKNLSEFYNKYITDSLGKTNKISTKYDTVFQENQ